MCYAQFWLGIAFHSTTARFHCKSLSFQDVRRETCNAVIWPADAIRHKTDRHLSSLDFPSGTTGQIWTKNMQYVHCNKDSLTNLKVKVICMLQPNKPQNPISSRTVTFTWMYVSSSKQAWLIDSVARPTQFLEVQDNWGWHMLQSSRVWSS